MKKLFDRRMVGFMISVGSVCGLASKVTDPVAAAGVISMGMNMILGMFGILVGGNVIQAVKSPPKAE